MDFDSYFISIANVVRTKSKDPRSKIGAIIVGPERQVISTGYNGFPRGIDETDLTRWKRPIKYGFVVHAEVNAIYNAARHGITLRGCTMYLVAFGPAPCTECVKAIIQSGIVRVVSFAMRALPAHWLEDLTFAKALLLEAGVRVDEVKSGA